MPMLKRPDGEICYEEFVNELPVPLFAPDGPVLPPGTDIPRPTAISDERLDDSRGRK